MCMCVKTCMYVNMYVYLYATCLIQTWLIHVRHDLSMNYTFIVAPRNLPQFEVSHKWALYVRHEWLIRDMTNSIETWLIHMRLDLSMDDTFMIPPWHWPQFEVVHQRWLIYVRNDSFIWDTLALAPIWSSAWDMTHLCETWLIFTTHDSFMWDMTHPWMTYSWFNLGTGTFLKQCMRHDSFMWDVPHLHGTWLIHMRHDLSICDTCILLPWDCPYFEVVYRTRLIYARRASFIRDKTRLCKTWLIHGWLIYNSTLGLASMWSGVFWQSSLCI